MFDFFGGWIDIAIFVFIALVVLKLILLLLGGWSVLGGFIVISIIISFVINVVVSIIGR